MKFNQEQIDRLMIMCGAEFERILKNIKLYDESQFGCIEILKQSRNDLELLSSIIKILEK